MSNRTCRALRSLLNLPRVPKTMDPSQRASYRALKSRYAKLPSDARALFKANVAALRSTMADATLS